MSFATLGAILFWYVYKEQNFNTIWNQMHNLNWWWVVLGMTISIFSHISRAVRWQILIHQLGYKPRLANTIFAVFIMYISNLAIPRMGEVARCGVLKRYEKVPFTQLLGTVFLERMVDMLVLLFLTAIVLVTQFSTFVTFLDMNPAIRQRLTSFLNGHGLLISGIGIFTLLVVAYYALKNKYLPWGLSDRIDNIASNFGHGLQTILKMPHKFWFFAHTIIIWVLYYSMLYVGFFAFDFSSNLSMNVALVMFVFGSYGMVAPIQGGIGAWHFMVIQTLLMYQISPANAAAFAFVVHAAMTFILLILGVLAIIAIPIYNRRTSPQT
ncbi:MAG: hypothetical protein RIS47_1743 [Bacteroidota bacterium]